MYDFKRFVKAIFFVLPNKNNLKPLAKEKDKLMGAGSRKRLQNTGFK